VLLDILTGLRVSELLALKWSDWISRTLNCTLPVPLLFSTLVRVKRKHHRNRSRSIPTGRGSSDVAQTVALPMNEDWVFASPASRGELPYCPFPFSACTFGLLSRRPRSPEKWDGTRSHSYATILKSHGEDVKTVQELLRHANSSVTMNLYAQAVTDIKRSAQSKVARLVFKSDKGPRKIEVLNGPFWTGGGVGDFL